MADQKKLDRWADKLLDTGKRNNLVNFRDTKLSSAEIVFPDCEIVFSKCSVGHLFEIYDPKIPDEDIEETDGDIGKTDELSGEEGDEKLTKREYIDLYSSRIKNQRTILVYSHAANPITAIKNVAKKAKQMQDETGINVAYLAFGFIKWKEKEGSENWYRAPLLLVHINIITGSVLDPVKIEISDDDVVVNPTFDYLLQAEYKLSLPSFEDGETLASYYEKVSGIIQKMGWEVVDECKLGVFSFLKINMYEDLKKNGKQILQNDNVKVLLGEPPTGSEIITGNGKRVENPLLELHTVIDADSSQIEAVEMAKSGKSFVLQGPPGTGKSQTITNIIAECLYDGKKVLFVSEKQAALNVVFSKLKKAGLDDFCLELHSHKANKKALIEELNRTLETSKSGVSSRVQEEIRQKQAAQVRLDEYATALHEKRKKIDKSLYQLFQAYSAERNYPEVQANIRMIQDKGADYLLQAVSLLGQYAEYISSIGQNYRDNTWYGFTDREISYEERTQLQSDLTDLLQGYKALQQTTIEIKAKYETPDLNYSDTARWRALLLFSAESDVITPSILSQGVYDNVFPYLEQMQSLSASIVPARDRILQRFDRKVLDEIDGRNVYTKLTGQFKGFFSRLFSGEYKNLIAGIRIYDTKGKTDYQSAVELAEQLMKLQSDNAEFKEKEEVIRGTLGPCYNGPDTDWQHVMSSLQTLKEFIKQDTVGFGSLSEMSTEEFKKNQELFKADSMILSDEMQSVEEAKKRVSSSFNPQILNLEKDGYDRCIQKIQGCVNEFDKLGNWISFLSLLAQIDKAELSSYIDLVINKKIEADEVVGSYKRAFYKQWIEYVVFSVPELKSFTRIKQDQAVRTFIEKDHIHYEISKSQIKAELSQKRPNLELVAGGSAVAILRREGQKKRKQMPIRRLLSEIGDLVQTIKPCFLMSPLSVSTFLDPEKISFDVVVFDEASQIFPQDAIGAVYRGKQLIVVGDSKQMPPSNFFSASTDIEDDDEEIGDISDFESILDICSSVFSTERLAWHYRSHYEQLIAFSNANFYNNHLVTFPSAATDQKGIGVDYYYVDGVFDRKSKTNRAEAEFIVDLVYKNIETHPDRSLGVVAFSVSQQNLIDKLLSKRRETDPSYEWFFKQDNPEPFFVKNLETVQGDERDTIIFSIAYAKDSAGRFIHNFGPLNRQGGERRLNVAVTRAKDNVQLVASIHYTDINLSKTGSEGVRLLRAYLDYAQNGEEALERMVTVSGKDHFDSYFEQEVCDFLRDNGFTVDTQVGCSGYRIDLGLRKPESSHYLLAIECDGATYHSSKNARDRDSLRQQVLESMGWKFYRIWSTDWYRNTAVEKDRLLSAANEAVRQSNQPKTDHSINMNPPGKNEEAVIKESFVSEVKETSIGFPLYKELDALSIVSRHAFEFQNAIIRILESEAPLSEEYLLKRIAPFFGREKVTKVVVSNFDSKMYNCKRKGIIRKEGFLYLKTQTDYKLRIPGDKREIKYISIEELSDGLYTLIKQNVTANREGIYKTLTNILGFNRTGEAIVSRFDDAITYLKRRRLIKEEDGTLSLR